MRNIKVWSISVDYATSWKYQKCLSEYSNELRKQNNNTNCTGFMLLPNHDNVYTIGKGGNINNILLDKFAIDSSQSSLSPLLYRIERGGDITWHGPGQFTTYPILNLDYYKKDLHWYLRQLENTVIHTLLNGFQLGSNRNEMNTGVWMHNNKISTIGITASRWITMHGCSINVNCDLQNFKKIIPCGISAAGYGVTSLEIELRNRDNKTSNDNNSCENNLINNININNKNVNTSNHINNSSNNINHNSNSNNYLLEKVTSEYLKSFSSVFEVDIIYGDDEELKTILNKYPDIMNSLSLQPLTF